MNGLRNRHFLLSDVVLLIIAAYASYVLRFESFNLAGYIASYLLFAVCATATTILLFWFGRLYARYWRYASVNELLLLTAMTSLSTVLISILLLLILPLAVGTNLVPRSIPFIFLPVAVGFTAAPRLAVRVYAQQQRQRNQGPTIPVLVMGAGDAGALIVREMQNNPHLGMDPVGYLDDDPSKHHTQIYGVPVLGDRDDIPALVDKHKICRVVIAIPTATGSIIREIVRICELANVETRIIPGLYKILDGTVSVNQLREVEIEDLLRRDPIYIDTSSVINLIRGKRILVTGGGGSIGSELCRQIASFDPSQLILLGHGENSIFEISNELRRRFTDVDTQVVIADVRDRRRLANCYREYQPQIVFHAAAHKHVTLMEENPCEAITNNVLGTRTLVELAAEYGVSHFVLISTDKAVNPTSVMGASKRCAELVVHRVAHQTQHPYVAVRFGNVLGSRGSVVPFFKQQIASGGPVTVTHPDMVRYFMTIPEAVQLVLQAATLGQGGEVFVLDMGDPVRIQDLARDLIELSGLRPHEDIEIQFTGVRPGEKLFEELFIEAEAYTRTRHEKIFVVQNATHSAVDQDIIADIDSLIAAAQHSNDQAIRPLLKQIVPEYLWEPESPELLLHKAAITKTHDPAQENRHH